MKSAKNPPRLPEAALVANTIKNFVVKHRQQRYLALVAKPATSGGYGFELAHFAHNLDLRFCRQIPNGLQYAEAVIKEIRLLTTSTECYIMHENRELDGQWMDLEVALHRIVGKNLGAFVIVDNGEIIHYESETVKQRYLGVRRHS